MALCWVLGLPARDCAELPGVQLYMYIEIYNVRYVISIYNVIYNIYIYIYI